MRQQSIPYVDDHHADWRASHDAAEGSDGELRGAQQGNATGTAEQGRGCLEVTAVAACQAELGGMCVVEAVFQSSRFIVASEDCMKKACKASRARCRDEEYDWMGWRRYHCYYVAAVYARAV